MPSDKHLITGAVGVDANSTSCSVDCTRRCVTFPDVRSWLVPPIATPHLLAPGRPGDSKRNGIYHFSFLGAACLLEAFTVHAVSYIRMHFKPDCSTKLCLCLLLCLAVVTAQGKRRV